jgi:hypothetical protein
MLERCCGDSGDHVGVDVMSVDAVVSCCEEGGGGNSSLISSINEKQRTVSSSTEERCVLYTKPRLTFNFNQNIIPVGYHQHKIAYASFFKYRYWQQFCVEGPKRDSKTSIVDFFASIGNVHGLKPPK